MNASITLTKPNFLKKIVNYFFSPAQPSTPAHNSSTQEMHSRLEMYANRLVIVNTILFMYLYSDRSRISRNH
jgi:hypothetical protein